MFSKKQVADYFLKPAGMSARTLITSSV